MNEPNALLTICLIIFNIITLILFKKHSSKKKDLSHYEAIADEHLTKMYKPSSDCWGNIILLCVLGFQIGWVYLLVIYFLFQKMQTTNAKLTFLQSSIDLLAIKQGLITMWPKHNAYTECSKLDIELADEYDWDGEKTYKRILYKIDNKVIYNEQIGVKGLTEDEIENIKTWHTERFRDYMRYIPKNILRNGGSEKIYDWFLYLDDVRERF
jgi:hypothetical protein